MLNTILSFPEFPEFPGFDPNGSFDPNASYDIQLQANSSYVITRDHCLGDNDLRIPANVTLYFMGGKILPNPLGVNSSSSEGTVLIGNQTKIIARIEQIFDISLSVEGTWLIDRAYPQWFGAIGYPLSAGLQDNYVDSADAINKAILMKMTGEVFLPRGKYIVKKTIHVRYGINLIGETGINANLKEEILGTVLMAGGTNINTFTNGYMMMVNVKLENGKPEWEVSYPSPGTFIKNIKFRNNWKKIKNLKCIYSIGNIELHRCSWERFQQALQCNEDYSDQRKITYCSYDNPLEVTEEEYLYAFDLGYLGDALVFEQNGIHENKFNKGLRVSACNGGSITSNIINADVLIKYSKGVVFNGNHMEKGQLIIDRSCISIANNFFWKKNTPNLLIRTAGDNDTPVINMQNNLFLFYDAKKKNNNTIEELIEDISNTSEYDIQIITDDKKKVDGILSLDLLQNYRYWVRTDVIGKLYPYGIKICDRDLDPVNEFNNLSYLLSRSSAILPNMHIVNNNYMNELNTLYLDVLGLNGNNSWLLDDVDPNSSDKKNYYYRGQVIWDLDRKILGKSKNYGPFQPSTGVDGIMMNIVQGVKNGYRALMRIYRGESTSYTHYVDVPVSGTKHLYDNGISICGYKWKPINVEEGVLAGNTNIQSVNYKGEKIECQAPAAPTAGTWQEGDIVFNTNKNSSVSMWIYLSGSWVAR